MSVVCVSWIFIRIRRWQPLKRVRDPDDSIRNCVRFENGAHEDTRAATPSACFDQVAWDVSLDDVFHRGSQIVHAQLANHRMSAQRPIEPTSPLGDVEYWWRPGILGGVFVNQTEDAPLHQVDIQFARALTRHCMVRLKCLRSHEAVFHRSQSEYSFCSAIGEFNSSLILALRPERQSL